ncbi:MAG: sulfatase-like hydrolase/transferase [Thermoguttaceae bacterium]|nr:sulfatase-like hydrolase/transferase [Thermoguttaceae bacterium]
MWTARKILSTMLFYLLWAAAFVGGTTFGWGAPEEPAAPSFTLPSECEPDFVRLDNGRDLSGWYPARASGEELPDVAGWEVRDGAICLEASRARANLFSRHTHSQNCIIRLQFRASPGADSGVFIHGKQFQVRDYPGSLPDTKRYAPYARPAGEWNELEFDITDGIAVVRLNGQVIERRWPIGERAELGIGLQREVGDFAFRLIRIKEKPAGSKPQAMEVTLPGPAGQQPVAKTPTRRPNIIVFITDDQRWDTLGIMGNPIIQTPNIDSLGRQGVVFDNCFVTTSICAPNRACIFTGQYASRHGIWDFQTPLSEEQLRNSYVGQLKAAGYWLGFIGKWGVGDPPKNYFDYDRAWPGQNNYLHWIGGKVVHLEDMMADQAEECLRLAPADRPFCLSFSSKAPHCQDGDPDRWLKNPRFAGLYERHPSQFFYQPRFAPLYQEVTIPPAPLSEPQFFESLPDFLKNSENRVRWKIRFATPEMYQETVKAYYRLITGVDETIGRMLKVLRERGLADNTVIIFSSDNGFYLGERGFAGKWYPHEVSIRVPLVIYDPRLSAELRGKRRQEMVLSIDIAPTVLELAGLPVPPSMQGRSLVPLLRGESPPWREEFYYEHLFEHPLIPKTEGVRTTRWKYFRYLVDPPYEELYDLRVDPHEAKNLASDPRYTAVLNELRAKTESWRNQVRK